MTGINVATVAGDPDREAALAGEIAASSSLELVLRCLDRVETLAVMKADAVEALIVTGAPVWFDDEVASLAADRRINIVGLAADPLDAEALVRRGADVLPLDSPLSQIVATLQRVNPVTPDRGHGSSSGGRVVTFVGAKGSPGASSLAVEVAAELAIVEPATVLVDADPAGGDLQQMLGVVEALPNLSWLARSAIADGAGPDMTAASLKRASVDGPVLVPGLVRPDAWAEVGEHAWRRLLDHLQAIFRHVIVDAGRLCDTVAPRFGASPAVLLEAAAQRADHVVCCGRGDVIGLRHLLWTFDRLCDIVDEDRVAIVVTRARGPRPDLADLVLAHTGRRVTAFVPEDVAGFRRAVERGLPLRSCTRSSPVTDAVRDLTASIGGQVERRGVLARLAGAAS